MQSTVEGKIETVGSKIKITFECSWVSLKLNDDTTKEILLS